MDRSIGQYPSEVGIKTRKLNWVDQYTIDRYIILRGDTIKLKVCNLKIFIRNNIILILIFQSIFNF